MATTLFQIGSGWFPERKGGAENVFYNLFRQLPGDGFAVHGVVPGSSAVAAQTAGRMQGFAAEGVPFPQRALAIRRGAQESLAHRRPDLIASHFALYALPLFDRVARTPFIVHFHGPWARESLAEGARRLAARAKHMIETMVYRRAERVLVLSQAFAAIAARDYGVREQALRLVPGGVDCARFDIPESRAAARAALGWPADRPCIFTARRLVRRMGLDRLIEAMAILRRRRHDPVLMIAGSGPAQEELAQRAAARGVAEGVRFLGHVADAELPLAYRAADLTIMPSAQLEGFGLAAAESLAAGTPVLVTPVGGLPEVVAGLSEALVLPATDAEAIAEGLAAALAAPATLPDAEACRRHARAMFDWDVVTHRVAGIYREVL